MSEQQKKRRGRPRKEAADTVVEQFDESISKAGRRIKKNSSSSSELYVAVTQGTDTTGSCRFGYCAFDPEMLCMFLGPIPDVYRVMRVPIPKSKRGNPQRGAFERCAKLAQEVAVEVYAMPKGTRPKGYREMAVLIRQRLEELCHLESEDEDDS
jgi:hypothetical protein